MSPEPCEAILDLAARPEAGAILRLVFLAGLACCAVFALFTSSRPLPADRALRGAGVITGMSLCVLAILGYQATWQLAGFARPRFLRFMRHYDRRSTPAADTFHRGRILDRNGLIIAMDSDTIPPTRMYTMGPAGAHIIGYNSPQFGKTGLEKAFDPMLSGREPASKKQFTRLYKNLMDHASAAGFDLRLTLDSRLQQVAYAVLAGRAGACVILDPRNGAILTLVSSPSFDPEVLAMHQILERRDAPLLNRVLQGRYPPGSAFKPLIAAAALEEGIDPIWDCPAEGFRPRYAPAAIHDHEFYEWQRRGRTWPGRLDVDLDTALAKSSNVYFARLGVELGYQAFNRVTAAIQFNQPIRLTRLPHGPAAIPSLAPRLTADDEGELAQCSIGQGQMLATPMQMALLGAAIAKDGILYAPRLVRDEPPTILGRVFSPESTRRVRRALRDAVRVGTGRKANLAAIDVAGKTGTAQAATGADHAWFMAMAPAEQPQLVLVLLVEHAGYASQSAVPMTAEILRAAVRFGIFSPDARGRKR